MGREISWVDLACGKIEREPLNRKLREGYLGEGAQLKP